MTGNKVILFVSFVLAFAAGTALGVLVCWSADGSSHGPVFWRELDLTKEQREQMREIWSDLRWSGFGPRGQSRRTIAQKRDEAIVAMLTDE